MRGRANAKRRKSFEGCQSDKLLTAIIDIPLTSLLALRREGLSLVIPMQRKRNKNLVPGVPARPLLLMIGLAACFAACSVLSTSLAQPEVGPPGAPAPEVAPRQTAAQIEAVLISFLPNTADTRLSDGGLGAYRRGTWIRILIQFATQPNWIDDLRFDCYVLLRDGNQRAMLTGSVTCTYVQSGRRHLTCLFVPPNVMERYGRRVEGVAVLCYYGNSLVADYLMPRTTQKWWEDYSGVPDTMVTWFYTPFSREGIGMYEQVKIGR